MTIQIEKQIEVQTDRNFEGLNVIIKNALAVKTLREFRATATGNPSIQETDFFIYYGSSHVAIHEILPNGEKSERLLIIR